MGIDFCYTTPALDKVFCDTNRFCEFRESEKTPFSMPGLEPKPALIKPFSPTNCVCYDLCSCKTNGFPSHSRIRGEVQMQIGYARVSTAEQSLNSQIDALKRAGVDEDRIYIEKVSAVSSKRPQLMECLKTLRPDDVLVVYKLDRIARRLKDLIDLGENLAARGIGLRSLSEQLDSTTPSGKLMFHIFGAVAQFERDLIIERTKAGLAAARKRGRKGGRKPKLTEERIDQAERLLKDPNNTVADVANLMRVADATLYRALAKRRRFRELKQIAREKKRKQKLEEAKKAGETNKA